MHSYSAIYRKRSKFAHLRDRPFTFTLMSKVLFLKYLVLLKLCRNSKLSSMLLRLLQDAYFSFLLFYCADFDDFPVDDLSIDAWSILVLLMSKFVGDGGLRLAV